MSIKNQVTLTGTVERLSELLSDKHDSPFMYFRLKVEDTHSSRTHYFDCVCFKDIAENASELLEPGINITVSGKLQSKIDKTQDINGKPKIEVVASEVAISVADVDNVLPADFSDIPVG